MGRKTKAMERRNRMTDDLISRADAMAYPLSWEHYDKEHGSRKFISGVESYREYIAHLPSAQPKQGEVIPHRNYKYLSDYWCECGWHLGKKNDVNYCARCGKRVLWDEQTERSE